jgi:1-acyl-sn-glycerol-3-phosphate acyltransferase
MEDVSKADASKPAEGRDWRDTVTWYTHETTFARSVKALGRLLFRPLAQVECVGFEHIPAKEPCILASNHISNWDVVCLGLHVPRHLHFMAKIELYRNPVFAWAIRLGGSFPVNRGEHDTWALRQAGRILTAGQVLSMFPEGTRSKGKAQLRRGKVGAVRLALDYQVPIVPVAIIGTQDFSLTHWRTNKIRIEVGQPLDMVALAGSSTYPYETLRELTTTLMRQIATMLPPAHRGIYG